MDKFIIGDSSKIPSSYSTIAYHERESELVRRHISHNRLFFYVKCVMLDFNYIIMKDSEEGNMLQGMLNDVNVADDGIISFVDETGVKNMPFDVLKSKIQQMKMKAFNEGEMNVKMQFRKLMSI